MGNQGPRWRKGGKSLLDFQDFANSKAPLSRITDLFDPRRGPKPHKPSTARGFLGFAELEKPARALHGRARIFWIFSCICSIWVMFARACMTSIGLTRDAGPKPHIILYTYIVWFATGFAPGFCHGVLPRGFHFSRLRREKPARALHRRASKG